MSISIASFEANRFNADSGEAAHVFGPGVLVDQLVVDLAGLLVPAFLAEIGWNPTSLVLFPPPSHRLLGPPVCTAAGCAVIAPQRSGICTGCQRRLAQRGLDADQVALLPIRERPDRGIGGYVVAGCGREWASGPGPAMSPTRRPAAGVGAWGHGRVHGAPADVAAGGLPALCGGFLPAKRRHRDGCYCDAHQSGQPGECLRVGAMGQIDANGVHRGAASARTPSTGERSRAAAGSSIWTQSAPATCSPEALAHTRPGHRRADHAA